jgi:arylformamidase
LLDGVHDISLLLSSETVRWPDTIRPERVVFTDVKRGDRATVSAWTLGSHIGTHVDAPTHFVADGKDIASVPLDPYLGLCMVLDLTEIAGRDIERADLEPRTELNGHVRVLFKTSNSRALLGLDRFETHYVALAASGAEFLVERGMILAGIDYHSIERFDSHDYPTHMALLGSECTILEGADLRDVEPGEYILICLPLRLEDGEASPVRALLVEPAALGRMLS